MDTPTIRVQRAMADLAAGRPVVLVGAGVDCHVLLAAEKATGSSVAFVVRHSSGFLCAAVSRQDAARVGLSTMGCVSVAQPCEDFTVTVDAIDGVGTGISARDRARTLCALADPHSRPNQFTRPGHVVPVLARAGGVVAQCRAAEAVTDLARIAGLRPVGAYAVLVSPTEPIRNANSDEARTFAAHHALSWLSAEDVLLYRRATAA